MSSWILRDITHEFPDSEDAEMEGGNIADSQKDKITPSLPLTS